LAKRIGYLLLGALLSISTAAAALGGQVGRVAGQVRDAVTDETLADVYVTVAGTTLGAVTDADGQYVIPSVPAGIQHLQTSFIGWAVSRQRVRVVAGKEIRLDFQLKVQVLPLDAILITARGRESRLTELTGSAGVVRQRDIARRNPFSVADAATGISGVSVGTDMPWGSRVQIRGLSRDNVVFLVNGNRVSTTTEVAAQFGTVALADVDQVEVLKGPISVLYGTGSTGGVVNIIPHSGRFVEKPGWSVAASAAYESVAEGLSGYARAEFDAPRYFLVLSQSYRDYASYKDGSGAEIANSQFDDRQSHLHLGCRLDERHTVEGRYQWFEARDVGIPGAGGVFPPSARVVYPRTRRWLAEATWRYRPSPSSWYQSELRLFLQTVERRAEVRPDIEKFIPGTGTQPLRRVRPQLIAPQANHDAMGWRWNNILAVAGHEVGVGVEGWQKELSSRRRRVDEVDVLRPDSSIVETVESVSEDRSLPASTYRPVGLYLEDEFKPAEALTLNAGIRFDVIHSENERTYLTYVPPTDEVLWKATDDMDVSWSAQTRATYAFSPHWSAHLGVARSFRSPGLEERYLYVDLGHTVRIGDPALDSEDGFFLEGGLHAQTSRFRWTGQAFCNRIENLVIEAPATFEGRNAVQKENAGEALFVGFESELDAVLHPHLRASADVAYVRGTDQAADGDLPAIAPLNGHFSLRCEGSRGAWAEMVLNLTAEQSRVAPGEAPTDGYTTVDLGIGYEGRWQGCCKCRFTIGLKNAFAGQYRDHLATSRGFAMNAPGRSLSANWFAEL